MEDNSTSRKDSKNKYIRSIGMINYYRSYIKTAREHKRKHVHISKFRAVIEDFNKALVSKIVNEAELVILPYELGALNIRKYKVDFDSGKISVWKKDYKRSKELGFTVYYDQPYRYKWYWTKKISNCAGINGYKFLPCRIPSRGITKALRENKNLDYFEKAI